MSTRRAGMVLASISAVALLGEVTAAYAQPYDQAPPSDQNQGYNQAPPPEGYNQAPPPYDQGNEGPPPGGYQAPPPNGYQAPPPGQPAPPPPGGAYNPQAQQYDQDYAARYSAWAAQYCVDRRNNNTAAGAIIGGVLGSILGAGIAGRGAHFAGAVVGGAAGATAGAAIGSSSTDMTGCPPGYVIAAGAPAFVYGGPYAGPVVYAPGWYNPWVWSGGVWVYHPYRSWYWGHPGYWHGGYYHHRY